MECLVLDVPLGSSFGSERDKVTLPNEDGSMDSAFCECGIVKGLVRESTALVSSSLIDISLLVLVDIAHLCLHSRY